MIRQYLKIGFRNILSNKLFSTINILGLSIGLVSSMLIFAWVQNEFSYDKFQKNAPDLYRLIGNNSVNSPQPLAPVLKEEFPDIVNSARFQSFPECKIEHNKIIFTVKPTTIDDTFFKMFSFKFLEGDPETVLKAPSSIVISHSLAKRIFGEKEALSEKLTLLFFGKVMDFTVTGIMEDIPSNSHIRSDCIVSMPDFIKKLYGGDLSHWDDWAAVTYIQTLKNCDIRELRNKIQDCIKKHVIYNMDYKLNLLQPVKDIHLHSDFKNEYADCRDVKYVYVFSLIAIIILLIACVNYANNTVSMAMKRLREVTIRKVIGASKETLIKQMTVEAFILMTITAIFSFIMFRLSVPVFGNMIGKEIGAFSYLSVILFFLVSILIISIIAGFSQTFYSLSFSVVSVLKSKIRISDKKISSKAVLTTFQFALAIIVIIGAIGVKKQIFYIQNMNHGFDENNLIYFELMNNSTENIALLKNELMKNPDVIGVTSGHLLTALNKQNTGAVTWDGRNPQEKYYADVHRIDFDFQSTYKTEMNEGRFFSEDVASDKTSAFVLNESALKTFGIQSPVGKSFSLWGREGKIIGIIKDFQYETAHNIISPVVLWMNTSMNFPGFESITLRIRPRNPEKTVKFAQNIIEQHNNGYKSEYHFLDSSFNNIYKTEQRFSKILNLASILAILLSCVGLFALISSDVRRKVKEIGIRKVNGAKVSEVMVMLNKDFIKWVAISLVIATPVAWYVMHKWLESFAYKTELSWWIFALAGLLAMAIALLTVSWQSWRAATRNPIEALRYE
jgi:putative ABC transport system permease protein